jgi:hypothetical protein
MKRFAAIAVALLLSSPGIRGQASPSASAPESSSGEKKWHVIGHGAFPVRVVKTLDSSKLTVGAEIEVETVGRFALRDGTLIPNGAKVSGTVTKAAARANGDAQSELDIRFAKINFHGKSLPISGVMQAVFPPPDELDPRITNGPTAKESGIGLTGFDQRSGSNPSSASRGRPVMTTSSVGVEGMPDLDLKQDGLLIAHGKTVKLGTDARMIIRAYFLE